MLTCPVCEQSQVDEPASCDCGYDFKARDPSVAIERYKRDARRGNGVWRRGLVALVALPITFTIGSYPTGILLGTLQLFVAVTWIIVGLVRADGANKRIAMAKELHQLPAARLLR